MAAILALQPATTNTTNSSSSSSGGKKPRKELAWEQLDVTVEIVLDGTFVC